MAEKKRGDSSPCGGAPKLEPEEGLKGAWPPLPKRVSCVWPPLIDRVSSLQQLINAPMDGILILDADVRIIMCNDSICQLFGYGINELIGKSPLDLVPERQREQTQKLIQGADVRKPVTVKEASEITAIKKDGTEFQSEVSITRLVMGGRNFYGAAVRDVTSRKKAEETLRESLARLKKVVDGVVHTLVSAIEKRDPYTAGHQHRVAELASKMAEEAGFSEERIAEIRLAAEIHDLGKISIPAEILAKPGRLTDVEFLLIKSHSQVGYDILRTVDFQWPLADIVRQHHERMNGSGYPQGISGTAILPEARIIAIADVVEAMASHRPYRAALGVDVALGEIERNSGTLFDPDFSKACLHLFRDKGFVFNGSSP